MSGLQADRAPKLKMPEAEGGAQISVHRSKHSLCLSGLLLNYGHRIRGAEQHVEKFKL